MDKERLIQETIKKHMNFQIRMLLYITLISTLLLLISYLLEAHITIQYFFFGILMAALFLSAFFKKDKIAILLIGVIIPIGTFIYNPETGTIMIFTTILNIPCGILLPKMIEYGIRDNYKNNK